MRWDDYHYAAQSISELAAVGSPTRAFLIPLFFAYDVLAAALGFGVILHAREGRAFRAAGAFILSYVAVGVVGLFATPLHLEGGRIAEGDSRNALHAIATAVTVLLMFAFIGSAAVASGRRFRIYSMITIVALLVGGVLSFLAALWPPAQPLQSVLGILERVNVYGCMLWLTMFAIELLRDTRPTIEARDSSSPSDERAGSVPNVPCSSDPKGPKRRTTRPQTLRSNPRRADIL
jgi:hypothetical protein